MMRRATLLTAFCVLSIVIEAGSIRGNDDDELFDLPTSDGKSIAKIVETTRVTLPSVLEGIVVDREASPVCHATVTLRINRNTNPFDETESEKSQEMTVTTDDDGSYRFSLGESILEPDDEIALTIQANGFMLFTMDVDRLQAVNGTLPALQLRAEPKNPWADWKDDTQAFNEEVAVEINDEPVLKGRVIPRYANYLISVREQMQQMASDVGSRKPAPTPKDYERLRDEIVLRELPTLIQKKVLAQYLMANLTREQRDQVNLELDQQFEKEIEKLQRELNASNMSELQSSLGAKGVALSTVKEGFALDWLAKQCIKMKSPPIVPISEDEILEYYEVQRHEFHVSTTLDWQQIFIKDAESFDIVDVREKLERIRAQLMKGASFEDVVENLPESGTVCGLSWEGTQVSSIADADFAARLSTCPLNQWSEVLEERPRPVNHGAAIDESALRGTLDLPSERNDENNPRTGDGVGTSSTNDGTKPAKAGELGQSDAVFVSSFNNKNQPSRQRKEIVDEQFADRVKQHLIDKPIGPSIVCVTARQAARRKPVEEVKDEIRAALTKEQNLKHQQKLIDKIFSKTKIRTPYGIPSFATVESSDDPAQDEKLE